MRDPLSGNGDPFSGDIRPQSAQHV